MLKRGLESKHLKIHWTEVMMDTFMDGFFLRMDTSIFPLWISPPHADLTFLSSCILELYVLLWMFQLFLFLCFLH